MWLGSEGWWVWVRQAQKRLDGVTVGWKFAQGPTSEASALLVITAQQTELHLGFSFCIYAPLPSINKTNRYPKSRNKLKSRCSMCAQWIPVLILKLKFEFSERIPQRGTQLSLSLQLVSYWLAWSMVWNSTLHVILGWLNCSVVWSNTNLNVIGKAFVYNIILVITLILKWIVFE